VNKGLRIKRLPVLADWPGRSQEKLLASQLTEEEFRSHRSEPVEKMWQFKGLDPINAKHSDWRSVVAEEHRTAVSRAPPQALLAKRDLPIVKIQTDVRIQKLELMD
jgi:hypothetical protein